MKLFVKAKANAKNPSLAKISGNTYAVAVKEPAVDGCANTAIAKALAAHLKIAPSQVRLIAGHTAKQKLFEIK